MPASAPIFTEVPAHACMVDFPHQCAVFLDLLDGWGAHKKEGTYTKRRERLNGQKQPPQPFPVLHA